MDPLSWQDIALMVTSGAAIHADTESTKAALKRGGQETNPIFGTPTPSGTALDTAEVASMALVGAGALAMPEKYRAPALAAVTAFEGTIAEQNSHVSKNTDKKSFEEAVAAPAISAALAATISAYALGNTSVYIDSTGKHPEIGISYSHKF